MLKRMKDGTGPDAAGAGAAPSVAGRDPGAEEPGGWEEALVTQPCGHRVLPAAGPGTASG